MRKIYTLLLALVASMTAFAQNPDPSKWEKGQNVAADLGMMDIDPTQPWTTKSNGGSAGVAGNFGDYWKGVGQKFFFDYIDQNDAMYGDNEKGATSMGYYGDGRVADDNPDLYQVIKFPAGYYTIRVQACYRDASGQQTDDCLKAWKKGQSKKNAWAYVETYADEASATAGEDVTRTFITPIRHIFDITCEEKLCGWTPNGDDWRNDGSFVMIAKEINARGKEVEVEKTYYYPRSIIGASYYFQKGYYWNEFDILLDKDTYVRIGYRKTDYVTEDWLALSEWQVIYNDGYTTEAQVEFAETEYNNESAKLEAWKDQFSTATFDGFDASFTAAIADKISDELEIAKMTYATLEGDELLDFIKDLKQSNLDYDELYQYLGHLSFVLAKSKTLMESTDYPGKAAFQSAYNDILGKINGCSAADFEEISPLDFCMKYFNELADARGDYLDTQEADENGAKDFSAVINHPWFVNDGVKISQDEEGNYFIDEETWLSAVGGGDGNYADKLTYTVDEEEQKRTEIASDVDIVLNDENVKNQWFQRIRYEGKTNGLYMYYDDRGLIGAADTWHASTFTSGSMDVCQNIVGLPSGYYSLKALIRGWGSGNGNFHNIFMENNDGDVMKSPLESADDSGWKEMTTGIIHVSDRQLLIGGQSDYNAHYTGFRLLFYGEEPPVDKLIRQEIAEVKEAAEALTFEGDKKYVEEQIAKCKEPYEGVALFEEYRGYLNDARKYITAATKEYGNYKAIDTYTDIATNNAGVAGVSDILAPAQLAATELGEGANDTYKDIDGANKVANKYSDYVKVYAEAMELDDASLNATLTEQKSALAAAVATIETLDQYISSLATPININKMKALGADKATEAAPVDLTSMIVNPSFELDQVDGVVTPIDAWGKGHRYGWTFEGSGNAQSNEYSRGNYEVWNAGSNNFTFYQNLSGMPAGIYEISCLAAYREGSTVTADMVAAYDEAGSEEAWANHNTVLFAKTSDSNDQTTFVKAIESLKGTEPSFMGVVTAYEVNEDTNEPYATAMTICAPEGEGEDAELYGFTNYPEMAWTHGELSSQPFDAAVEVGGTTYYFPESMYGFYMWEVKAPEKVLNKVRVEVKSGETLQIGLRKTGGASGDWVIFDDFHISYLSGDTFKNVATGIEDVTPVEPVKDGIRRNTAGIVVDESYEGIVIVDGVKVMQ
jgi:hypothetical protein